MEPCAAAKSNKETLAVLLWDSLQEYRYIVKLLKKKMQNTAYSIIFYV